LLGTLLLLTGACTRDTRRESLDTFEHSSRLLPAPAVSGPAWALHNGRPLVIGGRSTTDGRPSASVFILNAAGDDWRLNATDLPFPLSSARAVAGREGVLVVNSQTEAPGAPLWLQPAGENYTVTLLPELPGGAIAASAAVARSGLYVIAPMPNGRAMIFTRAHSADPRTTGWRELGVLPSTLGTTTAAAVQIDGDRIRLYLLGTDITQITTPNQQVLYSFELQRQRWVRHGEVPGIKPSSGLAPAGIANLYAFAPSVPNSEGAWHVFNTVTQTWVGPIMVPASGRPLAAALLGTRVTSLYESNEGTTLLTSFYTVRSRQLHPLDYLVLGAFGLGLLGIGWLHSRKGGSAEQYFRGGRNVNWLAAGLSIVATRLSATSFVSIPAKSFATNWQYAFVPLTNFVGAYIMSRWFVRFFVRLNVTSGYEYLERRFNPLLRSLGSLNYLAYELARIGILILVPAVALSAVAKFDLATTIVVIGVVVTAYTALGGIEGVIWADTFQILVKVFGLLLAVVLIFFQLRGNPVELAADAFAAGKLKFVDLSWDFTRDTLWVFILFWLCDGLKSYVANQTIIQRFISTRNESTAQRTIWTSAIIGTAVSWLLLLLGTGLFLFYQQSPNRLDLTMDKPDAVFPWFIVFELPPGVVGILLAALIAAAMSSLDGALNSTSTVIVTDFYRRYYRKATDAGAMRLGRTLTIAIGLLATMIALLMSGMAAKSLFDQTLKMIGLFGGGLGGLFLLGMLTTRASAGAALIGFAASACVQFYVSNYTSLHLLTYMFTGMGSCLLIGWLAAWLLPERKSLTGLTVHTYQ